MTLKLHAFPLSPRSFKVMWAANHLGIGYELNLVDFGKNAQNAPEYLALNPNGRAPTIEHDGYVLWESNAILEYFASLKPEAGLLPSETRGRLAVAKWLFWESAHWDPACVPFVFERLVKPLFGRGTEDPAEIARATPGFERVAKVLDGVLAKQRFVAGESLTLADIAIGASLCVDEQARFPLEPYRGLARWTAEIKALPSWNRTRAQQVPPARAA